MEETAPKQPLLPPPKPEELNVGGFVLEVIQGIGVMIGLQVLRTFEGIRNLFFWTLDRLNIKARTRKRASAFPPGTPRGQKIA